MIQEQNLLNAKFNFQCKKILQCHIKRQHLMTVPVCRNSSDKKCWYGDEKCSFRHEETEASEQNAIHENQDITVKIFDMMETFTQKIMEIESKIENTTH